ncbi:MAG: hypothetical protein JXQ95_19205 [Alteromonas stellipolaris]|uniref:hypothetical protein n=1 Tax=Alteromonas stellipolaris TaxID=233316 RepID=UPI003B8B9350
MDILSLATGFLVGAFTGAAGTYLGNKYTDQRRRSESEDLARSNFSKIEKKFSALIQEMREDVRNPELAGVRIFFVKEKSTMLNFNEPHFVYYTDDHSYIHSALSAMEDLGYIKDITPGNCPKYRFTESFYDVLVDAT